MLNRTIGQIQFPLPALGVDINPANVVNATDLFPERQTVKPKPPGIQLTEARPCDERDQLVSQWYGFISRVDDFRARERQRQADESLVEALRSLATMQSTDTDKKTWLADLLRKLVDSKESSQLAGMPTSTNAAGVRSVAEMETSEILAELTKAPETKERGLLLSEMGRLLYWINDFLKRQFERRRQALEQDRSKVYAECRRIEDQLGEITIRTGTLQLTANGLAVDVNSMVDALTEAERRPFTTRFPNEIEIAEWKNKRREAADRLAQVRQTFKDHQQFISSAELERAQARQLLRDRETELAAIDRDLASLRG